MLLPTDPDVQEALDSIGQQVMNYLEFKANSIYFAGEIIRN